MLRRYTLNDVPSMLNIVGTFLKESPNYKTIDYNRAKMEHVLRQNANSKSFFCDLAFDEDKLIGGLCATTAEYTFSKEVYGHDLIFYIIEHKRSLRLATELVDSYIKWGKERGLREVRLASSTGIKSEKFNKLCEHLGFKSLGSIYSMEV